LGLERTRDHDVHGYQRDRGCQQRDDLTQPAVKYADPGLLPRGQPSCRAPAASAGRRSRSAVDRRQRSTARKRSAIANTATSAVNRSAAPHTREADPCTPPMKSSGARFRTHGGPLCQEGVLAWPGDLPVVVRLGGDCSSGFPRRCRVTCCRAVRGPAGAPGAAQRRGTNELDAGKRRPMIGERGRACWLLVSGGFGAGWLASRYARLAEWSHMHPFGTRRGGGCHDRDIRGPGCSVRSSSAAWPAHAKTRAHPGLGDPSRLVTAPCLEPGAEVMAAGLAARSASVSRCQARARSLRAIAVVAIFLPRRRAMAW